MTEFSTRHNSLPNRSSASRWRHGLTAAVLLLSAGAAAGCGGAEDDGGETSFRLTGTVGSLDVDALVDVSCEPADDGNLDLAADVELVSWRSGTIEPGDIPAYYEKRGVSFSTDGYSIADNCDTALANELQLPLMIIDGIGDNYGILNSDRGTPEAAADYMASIEERAAGIEEVNIQA